MVSLSDFRTVYTPAVMPPKQDKPLQRPTIPFAEMARRETRAVLASWDKTATQYSSSKESIAARHTEWAAALPEGAFDRNAVRACWPIAESAADNRITVLERAGIVTRLTGKPYRWEVTP
jgi:hypothetical protein